MSRKLPNWIDAFLLYTENTEPPEIYRKWTAISTLAAALQRKVWVEWGTERFYPNMFIVLVGPPATRKGTAMKQGKILLDKLGIIVSADQGSRQALIRNLEGALQSVPADRRTPIFHASLTVFASELTVFLGYEDKDMLSMLCKLYDCENKFVYETVGRGREDISNVWLNLFGGTTPGQLQAAVPEGFIGSGFTSRVVFIYATNKGKIVIKPTLSLEARKIEGAILEDLAEIHDLSGEFTTTPAFENLYADWRMDAENEPIFKDQRLDYYVQRRPTHLFKLATIYSASRSSDLVITEHDLAAAIRTLEEAEIYMPAVFRGIGTNPLAGITERVRGVLEQVGMLRFSELAEIFSSDANRGQLSEVVSQLQQIGLATLTDDRAGIRWTGKGG